MGRFLTLPVVCLTLLAAGAVRAAEPADPNFYRNKTVQFYIAYAAGGGFDLYARLAARHLGNMLEGKPAMVPLNNPGGGGILLANKMFFSLPRDGTAIGMTGESVYSDQLLGVSGADYDAVQFGWVGRLNDLPSRAATSLARLWQHQGKRKESHNMLSDINHWFTEGFATKSLQEAKAGGKN